MVGDPSLWEIVGADALRAVAGSDLEFTALGLLAGVRVIQQRNQPTAVLSAFQHPDLLALFA